MDFETFAAEKVLFKSSFVFADECLSKIVKPF